MLLGLSLGLNMRLGTIRTAPSVVAPTHVYTGPLITGASGNTRAASYSDTVLFPGDRVRVYCQSRLASTVVTTTAPAGEGYTLISSVRVSGHTFDVYEKVWGAGSTDPSRQTSTFTFSSGSSLLSAFATVHRDVGSSVVTAVQSNGSSATITTPAAAAVPSSVSTTYWLAATSGACSINAPTQGTLLAGGASYNVGSGTTGGAMALAVSAAGFNSNAASCSFTESANSPRSSFGVTIVDTGTVSLNPNMAFLLSVIGARGESRINADGWTGGYYEDPIARSGYYYSYAGFVNNDRTITLVSYREPSDGSGSLVQYASFTTTAFSDPAGVTYWPGDPHFTITLGCSKTGRLHVLFLAHGNESPMQYGRGMGPGDVAITFADWAGGTTDASYPQLENLADGTAVLQYRVGVAGGDGWQEGYEEKEDETGWYSLGIIVRHSTHAQSPYMQRSCVDPSRDKWHWSGCWASANTSKSYHDVFHVVGTRVSPGVWTWSSMGGTAVTLPMSELTTGCTVAAFTIATPVTVHNSMTVDLATGYPIIAWMKAAGTNAGDGTNAYCSTWSGSAWVNNLVDLIHSSWNMVNAPPNSERAVVRGPEPAVKNGKIYWLYSADNRLSTSGVPALYAYISTDTTGASWGAPTRIVDLPVAGACIRISRARLLRRGQDPRCLFQLYIDDVGDGVGNVTFLYNITGPGGVLTFKLP